MGVNSQKTSFRKKTIKSSASKGHHRKKIDPKLTKNLVKFMSRRIQAVIEAKGVHTRY